MPSLPVLSDELTSRVEDELVLLCSRTKVDAETSSRVKAITSFPNKVDWDYVCQIARRHSVIPLVYSQLRSTAPANVSTRSTFNIRSLHPANTRLAAAYGGMDKLPRAARLEELLRAWGAIYNSRLPASSNQRLRSVRLDAYRWEGGTNGEYDRFVESWRAVL